MKHGAFIDPENVYQPWIRLYLNYILDDSDKEDYQVAFQPDNLGHGWINNVSDKKEIPNSERETEETCPLINQNGY